MRIPVIGNLRGLAARLIGRTRGGEGFAILARCVEQICEGEAGIRPFRGSRAGLLKRDPSKPRALDLIGHRTVAAPAPAPVEEMHRLPLLGQIAAGSPLLAEENVEDRIAVPEPLGRSADFLLTVRGDSMIEAGILDGDTLVVWKQEDARNGDIVVALVGDDEGANEATVKTFYRDNGRVRLQPENSALEPIYADHVQVMGKVVGVFRSLR